MVRSTATFAYMTLGLALSACDASTNAGQPAAPQNQTPTAAKRLQLNAETMVQWKLPKKLKEISGLAITPDQRLLAHDDEQGIIYEINFVGGNITKRFAIGNDLVLDDFEGIAVFDNLVALSTSTGRLYLSAEGADNQRIPFDRYDTGLGSFCEFEGLEFDAEERVLLLPCKSIKGKSGDVGLKIFAWSVDEKTRKSELDVEVSKNKLEELTGGRKFAASGIAIDPETENRIVISAQQTIMLELSAAGQLLAAHTLPDEASHQQSEGITFNGAGQLLIADEGRKGRARLAIYQVTP